MLCLFDLVVHTFVSRPYHFTDANNKLLGVQENDVGTQYRYGIYFYKPKQENATIVFGMTTEALE